MQKSNECISEFRENARSFCGVDVLQINSNAILTPGVVAPRISIVADAVKIDGGGGGGGGGGMMVVSMMTIEVNTTRK